jgi:hypothetical protein
VLIGYPTGWTLAVVDDPDAARMAATALGAWMTAEIEPWRGAMPSIPQHMQR